MNLLKNRGCTISNPDQDSGSYIDLLINGNTAIAGYDLVAIDSLRNVYNIINTDNLELIEDFLDDHGFKEATD